MTENSPYQFAADAPQVSDFKKFRSHNPATGEVLAEFDAADYGAVDRAVQKARVAQKSWAARTGSERGKLLHRLADRLRELNPQLAALETADTGKPIQETTVVDVISGADCFDYFAGLAGGLAGEHIDLGPMAFGYTRREPIGVVAGIGAWNYPLQVACWKSAPALACGNAMIFKPADLTPLTAARLEAIALEVGIPEGVLQVVQGGIATGKLLTAHKDIRKITLTGSVATGQRIMAAAAPGLKQITLELGGKSPLIVFEDADLDDAVGGAILGNFYSAGEVCSNATRVFVHEKLHGEFIKRLVARIEKMVIGDPKDPKTQIGALISEAHMEKVLGYIARGKAEGAKLLIGGERVKPKGCEGGYFVSPALFDLNQHASADATSIARDEIFGPVMTVFSFRDEAEVIRRANATEFGLSAGVFTRDLARAHRVVAQLEAGTCWINSYNITPIEMPFGGIKMSGIGRENSHAALNHFTQIKSVYVNLGKVDAPY